MDLSQSQMRTNLTNMSMNSSFNLNPDLSLSPNNLNSSQYFDIRNTSINLDSQNSRTNIVNNKMAALVRHRMFELEGPDFCYRPMFYVTSVAPEIYQLLQCIQNAETVAINIINARSDEAAKKSNGIKEFFKNLFIGEENNDEFSLEERKKVTTFLSIAKQNLIEIYRVSTYQ